MTPDLCRSGVREMFVGRSAELEEIRRALASGRAELGIVYGRRRVGKSSLLERTSPGRGAFLFEGLEKGAPFGLAFERLCMRNVLSILRSLGIPQHQILGYGPFFRQPPRRAARKRRVEGLQIDLLIRRRGEVLTLVECKFSSNPVDATVIRAVERKVAMLRAPRRFSVERVLIAANGVTPALERRGFFHRVLDLDCLFESA